MVKGIVSPPIPTDIVKSLSYPPAPEYALSTPSSMTAAEDEELDAIFNDISGASILEASGERISAVSTRLAFATS